MERGERSRNREIGGPDDEEASGCGTCGGTGAGDGGDAGGRGGWLASSQPSSPWVALRRRVVRRGRGADGDRGT
ncbi:MAG: hypothetical protein FJ291_18020 [Planctomycetes bacterium]|nr:hypothetical protein [Planctomycetota bacterium]